VPARDLDADTRRDVARMIALWTSLLARFGDGGPYLFGKAPTIADAFFSSWGGDAPESINGCDSDVEACQQDNEWRTNLLQQDYTFFVPAPPKPAADPIAGEPLMVWASEDHCGDVPSNPGDPFGDDLFQVGEADSLTDPTMVDVGSPTCGTIPESVVLTTDANGTPGIEVTVQATQASYPSNGYIAFAKRYKVGWDFVPSDAGRTRTYQVHFDKVRVWRSGDTGDAEWARGSASTSNGSSPSPAAARTAPPSTRTARSTTTTWIAREATATATTTRSATR